MSLAALYRTSFADLPYVADQWLRYRYIWLESLCTLHHPLRVGNDGTKHRTLDQME